MLPAYAGMIHVHVEPHIIGQGAPRVCGDDPRTGTQASSTRLCSPRMRG